MCLSDKRAEAISIGGTTIATIVVLYITWKVFKSFKGGSAAVVVAV